MVIVRRVTGETPGKEKPLVNEAVHQDELHHHQGLPSVAGSGRPVCRLGQDRGDQGCERVMGAGWPLGACTRPRPTSWTTATL